MLRRLSLKLAIKHDILPTALFLRGVVCTETEGRGSGAFADVYCGSYGEMAVAVKRLRVYLSLPESKKIEIKQAFCRESLLWKHLCHRHVLPFLGVSDDVFTQRTICMVLPWMSRGNILQFIDDLQRRGQLSGKLYVESVEEWVSANFFSPYPADRRVLHTGLSCIKLRLG